jgi:hypothetical protein
MGNNILVDKLSMIKQIQENMFHLNTILLTLPNRLDMHILLGMDHKFFRKLSSNKTLRCSCC